METIPAEEIAGSGARGKKRLDASRVWRALAPLGIAVIIALIPAPAGLAHHAWYYFAIFAGVVAALVLEPLPNKFALFEYALKVSCKVCSELADKVAADTMYRRISHS